MQATDYLSDIERTKVEAFCNDKILKEAVRKVLLAGIYLNGTLQKDMKPDPLRNWALSFGQLGGQIEDAVLGQELRAYSWALNAVEDAFRKLDGVKVEKAPEDSVATPNPAVAPADGSTDANPAL